MSLRLHSTKEPFAPSSDIGAGEPKPPSTSDTLAYIAALTAELGDLAERAGLTRVGVLLQLAGEEADRLRSSAERG